MLASCGHLCDCASVRVCDCATVRLCECVCCVSVWCLFVCVWVGSQIPTEWPGTETPSGHFTTYSGADSTPLFVIGLWRLWSLAEFDSSDRGALRRGVPALSSLLFLCVCVCVCVSLLINVCVCVIVCL